MYGKTPRFKIDEYFELFPSLKNEFQFHGACPVTGKQNGLILIEEPLQILLPYFDEYFIGIYTIEEFFRFLERIPVKLFRRLSKTNTNIEKAKDINNRLNSLSKQIFDQALSILNHHKALKEKDSDYHVEIHVNFFINQKHRLYHPNSHNVLFHFTELLTLEGLEENIAHRLVDTTDWKSTYFYFDLKHCYLFNEIFRENRVAIDDLLFVDQVSLDYRLRIENEPIF